jgi:photosystem II stability/assembly factor-like uncharacterized protein
MEYSTNFLFNNKFNKINKNSLVEKKQRETIINLFANVCKRQQKNKNKNKNRIAYFKNVSSINSREEINKDPPLIEEEMPNQKQNVMIQQYTYPKNLFATKIARDECCNNLYGITQHSIYASYNSGVDWTEVLLLNNILFTSLACNSSGTYIVASGLIEPISEKTTIFYKSSDSGKTWQQMHVTQIDGICNCIFLHDTGDITALTSNGCIYSAKKEESTLSWNIYTDYKSLLYWNDLKIDSSGKYMVAVSRNEIYTSNDYGTTFNKTNAPQIKWISVAFSFYMNNNNTENTDNREKSIIVAIGVNSTCIYMSQDYGFTWTSRQIPQLEKNSIYLKSVDIDIDALRIVVLPIYGSYYVESIDYGESWQPHRIISEEEGKEKEKETWVSILSSSKKTIAVTNNNKIYSSFR